MTTAKQCILHAIHVRGIEHVKANAQEMADGSLCSVQHVMRIVRQVESGKIVIRSR